MPGQACTFCNPLDHFLHSWDFRPEPPLSALFSLFELAPRRWKCLHLWSLEWSFWLPLESPSGPQESKTRTLAHVGKGGCVSSGNRCRTPRGVGRSSATPGDLSQLSIVVVPAGPAWIGVAPTVPCDFLWPACSDQPQKEHVWEHVHTSVNVCACVYAWVCTSKYVHVPCKCV
jgi:hypothetical protein